MTIIYLTSRNIKVHFIFLLALTNSTELFGQDKNKIDYNFYFGEVTSLVNSKNEFSFLLFNYQGAKEVISNNAMPLFYKWPNKEEINNFIGLNKHDKYSYNIEGNLSHDIGKSMVYLTSYEGEAEARPGLKAWLNDEKAPGFKNILYIGSEASWIAKEEEKNGACVPMLPDYSRAQFIRARKMNAFHRFDYLDYTDQEMIIYKLASSFAFVHCFENFNAQNSTLKIKFVFDGKKNSSEVFIHDTLPLTNALLTETIKKFSFDNNFADSILINEVSEIKMSLVDNMSEKDTIVYLDKNKKPIKVNTKYGSTQKLTRTIYMTWGNEVFIYPFDYLIYNFKNQRLKNKHFPLIKLQIPENSMYFYRII